MPYLWSGDSNQAVVCPEHWDSRDQSDEIQASAPGSVMTGAWGSRILPAGGGSERLADPGKMKGLRNFSFPDRRDS